MRRINQEQYMMCKYIRAHMSDLKRYIQKKDELEYILYARAFRYAVTESNAKVRAALKAYARNLAPNGVVSQIRGVGYYG